MIPTGFAPTCLTTSTTSACDPSGSRATRARGSWCNLHARIAEKYLHLVSTVIGEGLGQWFGGNQPLDHGAFAHPGEAWLKDTLERLSPWRCCRIDDSCHSRLDL